MQPAPRRSGLALAFIVLNALILSAHQQPSSQADVQRDMREANRLLKERKIEEAIAAFQALVDTAHGLGLQAEEGQATCGLGEALNDRTEYTRAQTVLRQCLDLAERAHSQAGIGRASYALSLNAELTGRFAEAASFADRAVAAEDAAQDPHGRAVARLQQLKVRKFPPKEADTISEQIVEDARLAGDRSLEAAALHSWGDGLFTAARFEDSLDKLTRARDLFHEIGQFGDEGTVFNSIGRIYRAHGRLDEALKCQFQALALHEKYGSPFQLMQSHNAVAVVQNQIGNLTEARDHYERALAIARQSSSPRIQDFLNANIASLLIDQGEYAEGARGLEEVIAHGLDAYPSLRYSNLSLAYLKLNRPEDALAAAERALAACGDDQFQCLGALENRGAAHGAAHDESALQADVHRQLEIIEGLRAKLVPSDFLKQNFHEAQEGVYSAGIAIAFNHHNDRESLETAELASSRAFLDLLAARGAPAGSGSPVGGLTFRGKPAAGDLPSSATAAPAKADDVAAIAKRLHSTAVIYWPANDGLFIWVVKGDGRVASRRVDVSKARLIQLIAATSPFGHALNDQEQPVARAHAVTTRGAAQFSPSESTGRQSWRQLYELLIAPIRDQLPKATGSLLTIIPHGVLMNVSFAALQAHGGRYLLEDYAIHYAPAGGVLQFTAGMRRPNARKGTALLVADPVTVPQSPLDPPLPALPGARHEVASIAGLIPRSRVTLLEGRAATEPRVVTATASKAIVHFATHAIVRDEAPNDSYLAFGPEGTTKNGLLTARDVYDLRLNADLVVLSACRSGGGRVTGDGVATFARAFMYAGTPSVLVSLWDVADEPTSRLLPAFYRTWLSGASKARSVRRAQLQLLADLRAGAVRVETRAGAVVLPEHPIFWAGFALIGEPE